MNETNSSISNTNLDAPDHPIYEPERWNKNKYIRKSHNCYSYALNIIDNKLAGRCKKIIRKSKSGTKKKKKKDAEAVPRSL